MTARGRPAAAAPNVRMLSARVPEFISDAVDEAVFRRFGPAPRARSEWLRGAVLDALARDGFVVLDGIVVDVADDVELR